MTLKAVLFGFSGVIINDRAIHQQLIDEILIGENLRPKPGEYRQVCLGRSDRACLIALLSSRGRVVPDAYLSQLLSQKSKAYLAQLDSLNKLPIYVDVEDLIFKLRAAPLKMALASGSPRAEIEFVLERSQLAQHFSIVIADEDLHDRQSEADIFLQTIEGLNQVFPELKLLPSESLAIQDSLAGIQAAKLARVPVVGVAHTYPMYMLQRQASWVVDYLSDLELERVRQVYEQATPAPKRYSVDPAP